MGLVLRLVETGADRSETCGRGIDVLELDRPCNLRDIANLGLTLSEAKQLLARAGPRSRSTAAGVLGLRGTLPCQGLAVASGCNAVRQDHGAAAAVPLPGCGCCEAGVSWPAQCRSPPELDQLRAHLSALLTYHVVADVLAHLLPVAAETSHETLRDRTLKLGEQLRHAAVGMLEPAMVAAAPAAAITLSLDATFICSCHAGERHLEVRVGNAEASKGGSWQVFGVIANAGTDIVALIRRTLDALGCTDDTALTAFTDGCSGLRAILAAVGIAGPPSFDWFRLAMRLQHANLVAEALPADTADQQQAKVEIVTEVERLRWRTWNGKAKNARITLKRLPTLLPTLKTRARPQAERALRVIDRYLRSQSAWLVNYAERHRADLQVGTSIREGTADFLVNRRMAKSQQMRWSRRGADLLLQVGCAVYNGALGPDFGQLFEPASGSGWHRARAA